MSATALGVVIPALEDVDVLHVGQNDLTPAQAGRIFPEAVLGLSTHNPDQLASATAGYGRRLFLRRTGLGDPDQARPPGVGLDLVRRATEIGADKPWFAVGVIDHRTIAEVVGAGATRVVVVRAITDATDPERAARGLRTAIK